MEREELRGRIGEVGEFTSQMWKKSDVHYEGEVISHVADID